MIDTLLAIDVAILRGVLALPHPGWLNGFMAAASWVGIGGALWLVLALVLCVVREIRWREGVRLLLAIALVHVVVDLVLKPAVDRARPPAAIRGSEFAVATPETRSFPSGHAANAIAAAVVLTRTWRRARAGIWAAAAIIACARVYIGIHYPFDAVVGCVVGWIGGYAAGSRCGRGSCTRGETDSRSEGQAGRCLAWKEQPAQQVIGNLQGDPGALRLGFPAAKQSN
jgi:undecaprenyl-diphosphatase